MSMLVASEVIIPEDLNQETLQSPSKRRHSQASSGNYKRARLSRALSSDLPDPEDSTSIPTNARSERRASGKLEERKRGKRLFGALLGTLAQSSSAAVHKRRTDIEKKQQEKLKQQTEQLDDTKQEKLDALMKIRRVEQRKFDKQSMEIRHSNLLAAAHFIQTSTEPKLYYKPLSYLPGDEAKIKQQVQGTEAIIGKELVEYQAKMENLPPDDSQPVPTHLTEQEAIHAETNASESIKVEDDLKTQSKTSPAEEILEDLPTECRRGSLDENEEVILEGEEDTVIY